MRYFISLNPCAIHSKTHLMNSDTVMFDQKGYDNLMLAKLLCTELAKSIKSCESINLEYHDENNEVVYAELFRSTFGKTTL